MSAGLKEGFLDILVMNFLLVCGPGTGTDPYEEDWRWKLPLLVCFGFWVLF